MQENEATVAVTPAENDVAPLTSPLVGALSVGQGFGEHVGDVVHVDDVWHAAVAGPDSEYPALHTNEAPDPVTPARVSELLTRPLAGAASVGQGSGRHDGVPVQLPKTQTKLLEL